MILCEYRHNIMGAYAMIVYDLMRYRHTFVCVSRCACTCIPYSVKLSRKKIFTNFVIFQPSTKVFSTTYHTHYATSLTFRESFLHEMFPSYRSAKVFSLESFPLYDIMCIVRGDKQHRCIVPERVHRVLRHHQMNALASSSKTRS